MDEKPRERIGFIMGWFMFSTAVLVDGIQLLLDLTVILSIIAAFIGIVADIVFILWFKLLGVEYFGRGGMSKSIIIGAMALVGIIPEVDGLPEFMAGVGSMILITRAEDKEAIREWKKAQAKIRVAQEKLLRAQRDWQIRSQRANDNTDLSSVGEVEAA